jgi:hypothetical protein
MASRLQDVILRGTAASRPLATAVAPGTLYYATDTATTDRSDGTTWQTFADGGSGGAGTVTHTAGALALGQLVVGNASADLKVVAATDGQLPIGKTSDGSVALGTLTAGTGITVTNAAGAITIAAAVRTGTLQLVIDGGGSAITTGVKAYCDVPVACTITAATLLADVSGSIVIDVWKDVYANYPPTVADTITASAKPTITTALKSQNTTLTGWTTALTAGDILAINVDSAATITRCTLSLTISVP